MHYLFKKKFKEQAQFKTLDEWITHRNPVELISTLPKDIKVLIFYGLEDNRVPKSEQDTFLHELKRHSIKAEFIPLEYVGYSMDGKQSYINDIISGNLPPG